jgi:hypothetical protein
MAIGKISSVAGAVMGITKVDGRMFLDSGTVIVSGDAAVEIQIQRGGYNHVVALKFRTASEDHNAQEGARCTRTIATRGPRYGPDRLLAWVARECGSVFRCRDNLFCHGRYIRFSFCGAVAS